MRRRPSRFHNGEIIEWLIYALIGVSTVFALTGCPSSRATVVKDLQADIWVNQKLPTKICNERPELWSYGVKRIVDCSSVGAERALCDQGQVQYEEYVPYCDAAMRTFASMRDTDRKKWFDALRKEIGQ